MAMFFLPKVNPLYEQISAHKAFLPNILDKLGKGLFTGYLSHSAQDFKSVCLFAKGKLICAVSTEGNRDKTGFEAIILLFDRILSVGGEINVYSMTPDLAMCAHALLLGTKLLSGDEVRQVDIKSILARLKGQDMNGVVRFFTAERSALMFYKDGLPIGFYHDSIRKIETTPDEARKVAALPGARVEIRSTKTIEELMLYDLLQMVNLHKLWEAAVEKRAATQPQQRTSPEKKGAVLSSEAMGQGSEKLAELVEDLKEVAMAYLSKEGRVLIDTCVREAGGNSVLLDDDKTEALLKRIEDEARVIDSNTRIEEMVDLMRSEIAGRLAV
jgi:hypothetical protein